jgi:hypothetical protein
LCQWSAHVDRERKFSDGGWLPATVGDKLEWTGTASVDLGQGELFWFYNDGWGRGTLEIANRIADVPEPRYLIVIVLALTILSTRRARRKEVCLILPGAGGMR